jgi:hypothetical protein
MSWRLSGRLAVCAQSGVCDPDFREAETPEPRDSKPAKSGGLHTRRTGGSLICLATMSFPHSRHFRKGLLATGKVRPKSAAPGGLLS